MQFLNNRWDAEGLGGHGKIIFNALNDLVSEMSKKHLKQQGTNITNYLRDIVSSPQFTDFISPLWIFMLTETSHTYDYVWHLLLRLHLRLQWYETFNSWLTESEWRRTDFIPSVDAYLKVRTESIGAHTIVLPASCFLQPSLLISKLRPPEYEYLTKLLMVVTRLLNDIESYEVFNQYKLFFSFAVRVLNSIYLKIWWNWSQNSM